MWRISHLLLLLESGLQCIDLPMTPYKNLLLFATLRLALAPKQPTKHLFFHHPGAFPERMYSWDKSRPGMGAVEAGPETSLIIRTVGVRSPCSSILMQSEHTTTDTRELPTPSSKECFVRYSAALCLASAEEHRRGPCAAKNSDDVDAIHVGVVKWTGRPCIGGAILLNQGRHAAILRDGRLLRVKQGKMRANRGHTGEFRKELQ